MAITYKWTSINLTVEKTIDLDELSIYLQWEQENRIRLLNVGGCDHGEE